MKNSSIRSTLWFSWLLYGFFGVEISTAWALALLKIILLSSVFLWVEPSNMICCSNFVSERDLASTGKMQFIVGRTGQHLCKTNVPSSSYKKSIKHFLPIPAYLSLMEEISINGPKLELDLTKVASAKRDCNWLNHNNCEA